MVCALESAAVRIEAFHTRQIPQDLKYVDDDGIGLGQRWRPIAAAGLYVPGGRAAYPSSLLMNAIPARVAGVSRRVMVTPTPDGRINPLILAAAEIAGIDEIYRIGGAQAVAALAYGTATVPKVDKVVGPGNAYVAEAKRQVYGRVGIDSIAGPSEVLIVADGNNDPSWTAIDLLSQAEHDDLAQAILITDDAAFADRVAASVDDWLATLPRREIAGAAWENCGAIIVVPDLSAAAALVDRLAREHLQLAIDDAAAFAEQVNARAARSSSAAMCPKRLVIMSPAPTMSADRPYGTRFPPGSAPSRKRTTLVACQRRWLGADWTCRRHLGPR